MTAEWAAIICVGMVVVGLLVWFTLGRLIDNHTWRKRCEAEQKRVDALLSAAADVGALRKKVEELQARQAWN